MRHTYQLCLHALCHVCKLYGCACRCAGEIKIGDLGLATLIPLRWEESEQDPPPEMVTMQKVSWLAVAAGAWLLPAAGCLASACWHGESCVQAARHTVSRHLLQAGGGLGQDGKRARNAGSNMVESHHLYSHRPLAASHRGEAGKVGSQQSCAAFNGV